MEREYKIGHKACYIQDHPFKFMFEIPVSVAIQWVKEIIPNDTMGCFTLAKDLTNDDSNSGALGNGWLNKLFVIVGNSHGKWIAITNWDGKFSVYMEI